MSDLDLEINSRSSSVASTRSTGRYTPDPVERDYPGLSGLPGLSSFSFWSDDSGMNEFTPISGHLLHISRIYLRKNVSYAFCFHFQNIKNGLFLEYVQCAPG